MVLKYAIIGVGGLGGYYGGRLAKSGKDVHFLLHSDYEYVKNNGLKIDSVKGDFHLPVVNAYKKSDEIGMADVVLVCLKTTNNHLLKELIPPLLHKKTTIIMVQNGLGNETDVEKDFPNQAIAGALAFLCSSKTGPGQISHTDLGNLIIGTHSNCDSQIIEQITTDFNASEVETKFVTDLVSARWQKLIWNIAFNGLTVVLNASTSDLMNDPASEKLCKDLMIEVIEAANACGLKHKLSLSLADEMLNLTRNMPPYLPSMKLDFDLKRPMEIEHLYTRPINEAKKHGYQMQKTKILEQALIYLS